MTYKTLNAELEKNHQQGSRLYVQILELDEESQQIDFFAMQVDVIVNNPVKSNSPSIISSLQKAKKAGIKSP